MPRTERDGFAGAIDIWTSNIVKTKHIKVSAKSLREPKDV
jgi:hypothetical protein